MSEICPYCRTRIADDEQLVACEACGTLHHADCYAENCGCTIFGCSKAPADEPKLSVSAPELVCVAEPVAVAATAQISVPPPPPPGGIAVAVAPQPINTGPPHVSSELIPSIFGGFGSTPGLYIPAPEPAPQPKNRTTFIVLGALLGAFGAHSFYAGYRGKGAIQLAITLLSLGFLGPMSWMWAVIDICTINHDYTGVQFES